MKFHYMIAAVIATVVLPGCSSKELSRAKAKELIAAALAKRPPISDADLSLVQSARIHMAFHGSEAPGKRVLLNGIPVGEGPRAGSFAPRSFVELRPEHLSLLRRENIHADRTLWQGRVLYDHLSQPVRPSGTYLVHGVSPPESRAETFDVHRRPRSRQHLVMAVRGNTIDEGREWPCPRASLQC